MFEEQCECVYGVPACTHSCYSDTPLSVQGKEGGSQEPELGVLVSEQYLLTP